jgi:ABC-type transport system involved in cytochrome bd biosynthesis fused ATPase/permease subunit
VRLTTLGDAPVVLLDEPFLGIDARAADALRARISAWAATRLVVVVDHEERAWGSEAMALSLEPGRVVP